MPRLGHCARERASALRLGSPVPPLIGKVLGWSCLHLPFRRWGNEVQRGWGAVGSPRGSSRLDRRLPGVSAQRAGSVPLTQAWCGAGPQEMLVRETTERVNEWGMSSPGKFPRVLSAWKPPPHHPRSPDPRPCCRGEEGRGNQPAGASWWTAWKGMTSHPPTPHGQGLSPFKGLVNARGGTHPLETRAGGALGAEPWDSRWQGLPVLTG